MYKNRWKAVGLALFLFVSGCGFSKTAAITLNIDTGDVIKAQIGMEGGHGISFNKDTNVLEVFMGEEESPIIRGIFVPQDSYEMYYETAYADDRCEVIGSGDSGNVAYTFYTYDDGSRLNCEYIGWVKGSNTGVVLESQVLGKDEALAAFQLVSFEVEETMQEDPEYVFIPAMRNESEEAKESRLNEHMADSDNGEEAAWTSLEMKIDGVAYAFPYSFQKLKENGWDFDISEYLEEGEDEYLLDKGEYTYSTTKMFNKKYGDGNGAACIYAGFKNFSDEKKDIIECDLWAMEACGAYGTKKVENCPKVELPGGIAFGATKDEILAAYGQPEKEEEGDHYIQMDYGDGASKHMTLYVYGEDGLLDAEFRNYE